MLYNKLLKIKHFFSSKILQDSNLKILNQHGLEGQQIVKAFLKTLKGKNTIHEDQLFKKLNQFRSDLFTDNRKISFEEIGSTTEMTVAEVVSRAASPEIWTRFFYQLSKSNNINNVLEIGTNLGVSGQYFLKALEGKKNTKFITLEGVKGLCDIAQQRLTLLSTEQEFEVVHGLYDQTLIDIINKDIHFDLLFIDGNHRYDATLKYFELLKNNISDRVLVIFDDIHWSEGMRKAWQEIIAQKGVVFSINFFKLGIIVFGSKQSQPTKDHFELFLSL
jgi:predicted O-methyltransferase YrrM